LVLALSQSTFAQCSPGFYVVANTCTPCPVGFYCPSTGTTTPVRCTGGFYCMVGSIAPVVCPSGFLDCAPCAAGSFCPAAGVTQKIPTWGLPHVILPTGCTDLIKLISTVANSFVFYLQARNQNGCTLGGASFGSFYAANTYYNGVWGSEASSSQSQTGSSGFFWPDSITVTGVL
jgi:hypothetical protein